MCITSLITSWRELGYVKKTDCHSSFEVEVYAHSSHLFCHTKQLTKLLGLCEALHPLDARKPSRKTEGDPKCHLTEGETQMTRKNKNRCSNQLVHV